MEWFNTKKSRDKKKGGKSGASYETLSTLGSKEGLIVFDDEG